MNYYSNLEAFYTISETLSFSTAAKILKISQPAISKRIQLLEEELQLKLLQRDRKRVSLTQHGVDLKNRTLPLLKAVEGAIADLKGKSQEISGLIRIGALIDSGPFVEWCIQFQQMHPTITIQFEFLDNFQITEALKLGHLDFGIVTKPPDLDSLQTRRIYREQTILVTRTANTRDPKDYKEQEAVPFIRFRFRSPLRTDSASLFSPFFHKFRKVLGIKLHNYQFAVNSFPAMIEVLLATDTFAVMPRHTVTKQLERKALRQVGEYSVDGDIYLVHHDQTPVERKFRAFRDFLQQKSRRMVQ